MAFYGIFKGIVTQTADPEELGRIRAQVPQIFGAQECDWAWPVAPNIRDVVPLDIGDPVWISFEGGDIAHPVWLGTWLKIEAVLPQLPGGSVELNYGSPAASTMGEVGADGVDADVARADHNHDRQDDAALFWMKI